MPVEAAANVLAALTAIGLLDAWESPLGPSVMLSSLAAEQLAVELASTDDEINPATPSATKSLRWIRRGGARNEYAVLDLADDFTPAGSPGILESIPDNAPA